jgi:paraquat-inducible protein A
MKIKRTKHQYISNESSTLDSATQMRTALSLGIVTCHSCGKIWRADQLENKCPHCHADLYLRKPNSFQRCWAYLIAAWLMYIPANLMPIMVTRTLFDTEKSTILSGIIYFWVSGEWSLAIIVFVASFLVPLLKMLSLMFLLITSQYGCTWGLRQRTHLYKVLEFIGRWSMLDVFVVALLVGLVQIPGYASIVPGAGIVAFSAVVVLTMLASMSYDPRLAWDAAEHK